MWQLIFSVLDRYLYQQGFCTVKSLIWFCFSLVVDPHVFPLTFSQIALAELLFEKGIIHTAEPL